MAFLVSRLPSPFMLVFGISTLVAAASSAQGKDSLESRWLEFQKNPRAVMTKLPAKYDNKGRVVSGRTSFDKNDIQSKEFINKKSALRLNKNNAICNDQGVCLKDVIEGRAAAQASVHDFLDRSEFQALGKKPLLTLEEMDSASLKSATLKEQPWSDTYWPMYQGIIGSRYANNKFRHGGNNWKKYYDSVSGGDSLKAVIDRGLQDEINSLSPAEKYDLLISNPTPDKEMGNLTPSVWKEGEAFWKSSGEVESWMGICHGWAPASFMAHRPLKSITLPAANENTQVKFYPSDLKGLATYLWAKSNYSVNFLGGRCNDKDPRSDEETGRFLDEDCFDTNPGNWHTAVVNQIGVAGRSFVLDVTYDYEVWNQPVKGYSYTYFNPETGKEVQSLSEAIVPIEQYSNDKFKKFRSPKARYVVGVEMRLTYMVETNPNHNEVDSPDYDSQTSQHYMYDLELDQNMKIIGGEWYSNYHPDFLWVPNKDTRAESYGDQQLAAGGWTPGQPLPQFWRDIAVKVANRYGQVLANIVEPLIAESRKTDAPPAEQPE